MRGRGGKLKYEVCKRKHQMMPQGTTHVYGEEREEQSREEDKERRGKGEGRGGGQD